MIRSMTGYGTCFDQREQRAVSVEVRSGNHRFLDLHIRLPKEYSFLEADIAQVLRSSLSRGRVDLHVSIQAPVPVDSLLDLDRARGYMEAGARLRDEFQFKDAVDLRTLLALPGVLHSEDALTMQERLRDAATSQLVVECVRNALKNMIQMRDQEGMSLASEMRHYLDRIRRKLKDINALTPGTVEEYRRKLAERVDQLLPNASVDPQRLAQEVALLAERSDVAEELTRLESHLDQCDRLLDSEMPVGKEMDFLMQEMHREINTTLSKTMDIEITSLAIAVKAEVERLREQVQNVE
jgi:uncharacterized protein (TIGR00255 family)